MIKISRIFFAILVTIQLCGCNFIKNSFTYKDKTKEFVDALLSEDYEYALTQMALEHESAQGVNKDTLKNSLSNFRKLIADNFGTKLDYKFMQSRKTWSTEPEKSTPPHTTNAMIQFSNGKEFSVFNILFDDKSGKIININTINTKYTVPNMILFWLLGLLPLCVLAFNIYVIKLVKRSTLRRKWLKYMAIIVLNVPAISYAAVGGFGFKLLSFQILLGISFSYMGYLMTSWTFGLPLGGLYWFLKLRRNVTDFTEEPIQENNTETYIAKTEEDLDSSM